MPDPQEQSIFSQALEGDAAQRGAFLDEACALGPALRARVERLLHHHEHAASFLAAPAVGAPGPRADADATVEPAMREGPGTAIGHYKLLEQIGEGGMGVVFLAEQTRPVRRQVALKVIKAGMDTRQVIARFEAERQALAVMDHPNIARVLDAGATDAGRPYFVMELVKGVPITRYCDEHRLTPRDRLRLFVQVCQAVQHAHQKGIIHRDLKPGNVMVALYDGKPVPKVIDFGVAKATGGRLTEHTVFTGFGAVVGTPEYMSPEQAELNQLDIDTRSDVYSLGVILYELLTGSTPLERKQLHAAAMFEVLRVVREQDPPKPSTRLSTTDQLPSIAACRGLEPRKLGVVVRGELDWIVMKSLEKDRARRYETANGFAKDIERYLAGEAVQAVPPSTAYRLRKSVRRNKGPVVAASVVLLALVAGTIGTSIGLVRARQAWRAQAERAEGERLAKQAAQERQAEMEAALDFVENKVFAAARPEGHEGGLGYDVTLRRALQSALPFVESSFVDRPLIEARLRMTLAHSFAELGDYRTAAAQWEACRALYTKHRGADHPDTLKAMDRLGSCYIQLGRSTDGMALLQATLALRKATQGAHHVDTLATMTRLVSVDGTLGYSDAIRLGEEALALMTAKLPVDDPRVLQLMRTLANQYSRAGRKNDALNLREQTLAQLKAKFGPTHVEILGETHNLASSYDGLDRPKDALRLREQTLALARSKLPPDHPLTLISMGALASSYAAMGRDAEADKLYGQALALHRATSGPDHPRTLDAMHSQALSLIGSGRGAEAAALTDDYLRLAQGKDVDPRFAGKAGYLISPLFHHFEKAGDVAGCRTAAGLYERLNRSHPGSLYNAARFRALTAALIRATDKSPDAARSAAAEADRAMDWLRKAVAAGYSQTEDIQESRNLDALRDREEFNSLLADVKANQERALAAVREAARREPEDVALGVAQYRLGNWKEAALLLQKHPETPTNDGDWTRPFFLAMAHWQLGDKAEALRWHTRAVEWMEWKQARSDVMLRARGEAEALMGRVPPQEVAAWRQRRLDGELAGLSRDVQRHPGSRIALEARGRWLLAHGRFAAADADYERLVQLHPAEHWHWFYRGCLLAYLGREEDYREHCRAMLAQFAGATDFATIERTTKPALLLAAGAGVHAEDLAGRAERARGLAPDSPWTALLMGLAECRAGRHEQAAGWLEKGRTSQPDLAARTVAADAYLAVARHRLGQEHEARTALERAARRAAKDLPPAHSGDSVTNSRGAVANWLVAQTALREAEQLVLGRTPPPAPQASGPPVPPPPPAPTAPSPFPEKAAGLPGVVQAEDFDEGGQGVAYHDTTTPDTGAQPPGSRYRLESVEVDACQDEGGGFSIGGVRAGEWLAYTVEVKEAGTYDLKLRISSLSAGGKLHVEFGGKDVTGPVAVPKTGDWNAYTMVTVKGVRLDAGRQVMRTVFDAEAPSYRFICNLNWIEARRSH